MNPAQTDRELTALTDLLAPRFLDVQVQGQFHRLKQGQGEYTALYRMLALIKMLHWIHEDEVPGIDADLLSLLPAASEGLRKADVEEFQRVLAGAEVESPEPSQPPLFVEVESGFYMPNPSLHLRVGETWAPLADVMAFDLLSLPAGYGQLSKRQVILSLPRERPPHVPLPRTVAPATGTSLAGAALDYDMNLADLLALVELTGQADPVDTVSIMQLNSRHIRFTLERLRQARLVIEDDHAQLSALVDEGRYIRSSGRLRGLSDEALRLLLAWQAWRQPQELSVAALTELRLAHLGRVADELERGVGPMPAELDRRSSEVPKQVFVAGQVRAVASVLQKAKDQDCALVVTFGPDGGFFQFNFQDDQLWGEVGADSTERFDWPVLLEWNLAPSVDDPVHRRIFPASVDLEDAVWEVANVASRLLSYDGGEIDVELVD